MNVDEYEAYLRKNTDFAENTILSYVSAVRQYYRMYSLLGQRNLKMYKSFLIENYKPKTVNLRLNAINCYLECIHKVVFRNKVSCGNRSKD